MMFCDYQYVEEAPVSIKPGTGLTLTPRINPGYGNLALEKQRIVFALLSGDRIGVTLTEKCMMQPRKSLSLTIGIGEGFTIEKSMGRYRHCGMINCPYRLD